MKTETLIELQRSEPLKDQLKELENYCAEIGFTETAKAIALVPELIAEVIRLREVLSSLTELPEFQCAAQSVITRAALANDK